MAKKNFEKFKQDLEKKKIAAVYLFLGPQPAQKKEALKLLCDSILPPGAELFNLDQRNAPECEFPELQNLVSTLPWGVNKRIVTVFEVDKFLLEQRHQLAELVPRIPESTCLVLLADKLSEAELLYKAILRAGEIIEFPSLREEKLISWVEEKFRQEGKTIEPKAAARLVEAAGSDLLELASEAEKLTTYVGDRKKVTEEDVEIHISANPGYKVYQLIDFIAPGDVKNSLEATRDVLISQGFAGLIINQLLQDYFYLWRLFTYSGSRNDFPAVAQHLGLSRQAFRVSKYLTCSRNYNLAKVESALKKVCAVDSALRYSPLSAESLVEQLVVELCHLSSAREAVKTLG